jgi:hypothetical protein
MDMVFWVIGLDAHVIKHTFSMHFKMSKRSEKSTHLSGHSMYAHKVLQRKEISFVHV